MFFFVGCVKYKHKIYYEGVNVMLKLRKFKEKKLTNKNIMVSFVTIIVLLITLVFSKSYAIYKMQKEFDVIKSQIGTFTNGDVKVAVLVDGKETNEFPSYETNYKIKSVECTNGVTGSFEKIGK